MVVKFARFSADRAHAVKALMVVHNETSAAVTSDVAAILAPSTALWAFRPPAGARRRLLLGAARPRQRAAPGVLSADTRSGATRRTLLHGRRRGRKLRPGQQELLKSLLPRLAFTLPDAGKFEPRALFPAPVEALWLEVGFGGAGGFCNLLLLADI